MKINNYNFLFANINNNKDIFNNFINNISNSISDYKCIKSGSYNKLISAYYDKIENTKEQKEYITYNAFGEIIKNSNKF